MTTTTKILTIVAGLIFLISFLLPSRLTNVDFETFIEFAKNNSIGYGIYALTLFPFIVILLLTKRYLTSIILSTILLLTQLDLFDQFIDFMLADQKSFLGIGATSILYPFLLIIGLFFWLTYKSINTKSLIWYFSLVATILLTYLWLNDRNCRTEFVADMGTIRNDIGLWITNCGTYYAWWTSCILLNVAIFNEIKVNTAGNKV